MSKQLFAILALGLLGLSSMVFAEETVVPSSAATLPDKLEGRWVIEPGRYYGNTWSIKNVNGKWLMTWWKVKDVGCSVEDAPVSVKTDTSGGLEISLNNYECMKEFYAKLEKNGAEYKGDVKSVTTRGGGRTSAYLR